MADATSIRRAGILVQATPGTSNGTLFTVPAGHKYEVPKLWLVNTTGSAATIQLARNGTSATAGNQIANLSLAANSVTVLEWSVWNAGDTLQALQGTSGAVNVYGPGFDHLLA